MKKLAKKHAKDGKRLHALHGAFLKLLSAQLAEVA